MSRYGACQLRVDGFRVTIHAACRRLDGGDDLRKRWQWRLVRCELDHRLELVLPQDLSLATSRDVASNTIQVGPVPWHERLRTWVGSRLKGYRFEELEVAALGLVSLDRLEQRLEVADAEAE